MTENRTRVVEEPAGNDHVPTERIPVPGDLSPEPADEKPAEAPETVAEEPTAVAELPATPAEPAEPAAEPGTGSEKAGEFFDSTAMARFRDRWREVQSGFVDDPGEAVRGADDLVVEIMRELAERKRLIDDQWQTESADTEELRVVIRAYRAFFNHLLNA